jgi:hypothetical protein
MKKFTQVKFVAAFFTAIAMVIGLAAPASASTPEKDAGSVSYLNFSNNVKIGQFAKPGFTTRYVAVMPDVDAILTVTTPISNTTTINNVDRVSTKDNWQIWSNLGIGSGGGFAGYRIDFVATGSNDPVILKDLKINVGDIDAKQYVEFAGVQSYLLSPPGQTKLTATGNNAGAWKFSEDNGIGDPTDADPNFLVQVNYAAVSSVGITMGAPVGGSALFQVAFSAGNWANVNPVPVTPTVVQYTVTYDGNGATGGSAPSSTPVNRGTAQTILGNTGSLTFGSATFMGWNTRSDGSGVKYDAGDTIIPAADTTLYAMWLTPPKVVTYFGNTSTGGIPPASLTINGNYTIASPGSLVKDGYSFIGWNTNPGGTGFPYEPGELIFVDANENLYAQWQLIPTPPGGIDINTPTGSTTNGAEVPYNIPDLEPGEIFSVEVYPEGNPDAAVEVDAGYADANGNAIGSTTLPGGLSQGEYIVYFGGVDADGDLMQVVLPFSVGPNGVMASEGTPTRSKIELAKTGLPDAALPWLMSMAFILLILGAASVVLAREIKKRRK